MLFQNSDQPPWRHPNQDALAARKRELQRQLEEFLSGLPAPPRELPFQLRRALSFVHANLFDPRLSVGFIHRHCRIADHNLSTRLRAATGFGLREYVEAARVHAAKEILHSSELPISFLAGALGYERYETFCRAFKRQVGTSPARWRRRRRCASDDQGNSSRAYGKKNAQRE